MQPQLWLIPVLLALLGVAGVSDACKGRVPNLATYPAVVAGLVGQTLLGGSDGLMTSLAGMAAGFVPVAICWAMGGVGGGDAKLMAGVGALTNWRFALATLLVGLAVAVAMAAVVMVRRRIVRRTLQRIWRAVALAMAPGVKSSSPAGADSPRIPLGAALAAAGTVVLTDVLLGGKLVMIVLGG